MKLILVLFALGTLWAADPPDQPIPFSHKQHVGVVKLQCKMCHPNPDPGEAMTIVPPSTCMQCHSAIKADSPSIQKLAGFAKDGNKVPWIRIYRIPSFVSYSHRTHLDAKATCADCHGNVAESVKVVKEGDTISMGACMTCHQMRKVGIDCNFCHEAR